jgi:hypothetical protein
VKITEELRNTIFFPERQKNIKSYARLDLGLSLSGENTNNLFTMLSIRWFKFADHCGYQSEIISVPVAASQMATNDCC